MKQGFDPKEVSPTRLTSGTGKLLNIPVLSRLFQVICRCIKLARLKGKRLVEVIDTEDDILPIVCIFEDITNE